MHAIIDFLKEAVDRSSTAGVCGCYIIKGGSIYARNDQIQAGVLFPTDLEFNVPAAEFEAAISRMKEVAELNFNGDVLLVRGGRVKANISCVLAEAPHLPALPEEWSPIPGGFTDVLKIATLFTGERGWAAGIRMMTGSVTACSNASGVIIDVPSLEMQDEILISTGCVEFLSKTNPPIDYATEADTAGTPCSIVFRWEDGRWMRAQLLEGKMPEVVERIFSSIGDDAPVAITKEFREALDDTSALTEGIVTVHASSIAGAKGAAQVDVEVTTGVADDHRSAWNLKTMAPVVQCATHWNPASYPAPSLFKGPGIRGVVVGVKA